MCVEIEDVILNFSSDKNMGNYCENCGITGKCFQSNASNGERAKYQDLDSVPSKYELKPL